MKKSYYKIILASIFATTFIFGAVPTTAQAANFGDAGALFEDTGVQAYGEQPRDIRAIVASIVKGALSLLGIIFLLLVIYGGYLWMTAQGEEKQVQKAKDVLKQAIIGIIIVLLAYAITEFIISTITESL